MRNNYAGACFVCGTLVAVGAGYFQRNAIRERIKRGKFTPYRPVVEGAGAWLLRCRGCVGKGNAATNGKEASHAA